MKIEDLGPMEGRIVLWGGALGNRAALLALVRRVVQMGIAPGQVISTGDLAGYGAESGSCVDLVKRLGWPVVAGDTERGLAERSIDVLAAGRGRSIPWWLNALRQVGPVERAWMRTLPDIAVFTHGGRRHAVVHGGLTDPARRLWPVSRQEEFAEEIALIETSVGPVDAVIAGHCGIGFQRIVAGRRWINAGAIGMPPNNGVPGGQYVVIDGQGAHLRRLRYDPADSIRAMRRAGLTQGYDEGLRTGFWPCEAALPPEMRRGLVAG